MGDVFEERVVGGACAALFDVGDGRFEVWWQ